MKLGNILHIINGKLAYNGENFKERDYYYAIASDLMSNVLLEAAETSILITSLVNAQVIRASEMMNITCIVLTCGKKVTDVMVDLAKTRKIALVETPHTTFNVCGILHSRGLIEEKGRPNFENLTSIKLLPEACIGCTHCMKKCPTEAIRVKNWVASIIPERCIDCGQCVKVCPTKAARPVVESLDRLNDYEYKIAIPSSAFFAQFKEMKSRNHALTALKKVGFDEVYEEAIGAEMISAATRKFFSTGDFEKPLISATCPAVVKLIEIRFPNLIDRLSATRPPVEVVASIIREKMEKQFPEKKIGIFYIAPCTAKVSVIKEDEDNSDVDVIVGIRQVYKTVRSILKELKDEEVEDLEQSGIMGLRWANVGGECLALNTDRFIAVDGIEEVINILEKIDDNKLEGVDFVEADACIGGCLGGSLAVENVYSAKTNLKKVVDEAKLKYGMEILNTAENESALKRNREIISRPVLQLDSDLAVAIKKMEEVGRIMGLLPGIDCGACGAPTCRAFAEDVVRGFLTEKDCIVNRNN